MNIIVEGPDNSGKTTLVSFLSSRLKLPTKHSGGPSKYPGEVVSRAESYLSDSTQYIYDRHPCISQNIYAEATGVGELIQDSMLKRFYSSSDIIVFCRGRDDLAGHQMSTHSTPEYFERVKKVHHLICELYDDWALRHAHVCYRIGDDPERIADLICTFDPVRDIERFHKKFALEYEGPPRFLPEDLLDFRWGFMDEELGEYLDHNLLTSTGNPTDKLANALDALVDLVYVALGTSYLHGFNFREAWRRVQEANMKKVRAERAEDSKRGSTFDVIKPADWQPPDHRDLVRVDSGISDAS